jgi:hypothetical protein
MRAILLILILCLPAAATEDLTIWTETDTDGYLEVSESSVVATAVPRNATCYVSKDFGAGYFEDFEVRFEFTGGTCSHTDYSPFLGTICLTNTVADWYNLREADAVVLNWTRGPTGYLLSLTQEPSGTSTGTTGVGLVTTATTYYVTFSRDYDGGANGTGQYAVYICTTNYYGESGSSTVHSMTMDSPAGEQAAFRYALTGQSKLNGGPQTASGTISNLEFIMGNPPEAVTNPSPADEATLVEVPVTLSWGEAAGAENYNVYFSKVGVSLVLMGNVDANEYDPDLDPGMAYQWRIDPNNEYGTTEGAVWTFATALPKVTTPSPADEQRDVPIDQVLAWSASAGATDYDIYLGPALGSLSLLANITGATYAPALAHGQAYDWRVDPNNTTGATTGDVWTFYTETVPAEPNEPAPPEEGDSPSEWRTTRPWRGTPHWIRREGLEGWRKR